MRRGGSGGDLGCVLAGAHDAVLGSVLGPVLGPVHAFLLAAVAGAAVLSGPAAAGEFPVPRIPYAPRSYLCRWTATPPAVDGALDDASWAAAEWSEPFVDIEGSLQPPPPLATRMKMLWSDEFLFIAAEMEEPDLWATYRERDAVIYHENDFEVFLDPDGDTHEYYELELNALNTVWDLLLIRPYRDGGPAVNAWDVVGLLTAVRLDGTLNDPSDRDRGWTVEIGLPWKVLAECAHRPTPPGEGDRWRINFSRVEWDRTVRDGAYVKRLDHATGRPMPEHNWVWSPQGLIAMHYPEMWGTVAFTRSGTTQPSDPDEAAVWSLRLVYYAQRAHEAAHGRFAGSLSDLSLAPAPPAALKLHGTPYGFTASIPAADGPTTLVLSEDGRLRRVTPTALR